MTIFVRRGLFGYKMPAGLSSAERYEILRALSALGIKRGQSAAIQRDVHGVIYSASVVGPPPAHP